MKLDQNQLEVARHFRGPCLVAAVAGSGKSTSIVYRIAYLIRKGVPASSILATTFTRRAAWELNEKLRKVGIKDIKISTFHSICYQILREDGKKFGGKWRVRGEFPISKGLLHSLKLPASTEEGGMRPADILNFIGWCKNWLLSSKAAAAEPEPIQQYMRINQIPPQYLKLLTKAYRRLEKYRKTAHFLTYDDILYQCHRLFVKKPEVLKKWHDRFKWIIVDEVQDNCFAQHEILRLLSSPENNAMIVGDLAQCIPAGQKIATDHGDVPIEKIKVGDFVLSAHGRQVLPRRVVNVKRSHHTDVLEFCTRGGRKFKCTPNHVVFASLRTASAGILPENHHYLYLMWRKDFGYRVGISTGNTIRPRSIMEGAHKMWVLHEGTLSEVAHLEKVISLRYQIPTATYVIHSRNERPTDEQRNSLFAEFGGNGTRLLYDFGLSVDRPVWMNWTRRHGRQGDLVSTAINLCMADVRGKSTVHIESKSLPTFLDLKAHEGNRGTRRFRQTFNEYKEAKALAEYLHTRIKGSFVSEKISLYSSGPSMGSMRPIDAAQLCPGMRVALVDDSGNIYYDFIKSKRQLVRRRTKCFDLEVMGTANYFVGGVCVHNSIYSWRAALPRFMVEFEKTFALPEQPVKVLKIEYNYRSRPEITDVANRFLSHSQETLGTTIRPQREKGGTVYFRCYANPLDEAMAIAMEIKHGIRSGKDPADFAVICRVNRMMEDFQIAFTKLAIPFKVIGGMSLYEYKVSQDLLAYLQYARGVFRGLDDRDAFYRLINTPARGMGEKFIAKVMVESSKQEKTPIYKVAETLGGRTSGASSLASLIDRCVDLIKAKRGPADILKYVALTTGYVDKMGSRDEKYKKFLSDKIATLCLSAAQYKTTKSFLHHVEEVMLSGGEEEKDNTEDKDKVIIITVHRCVSLDTIVETPCGLMPINDIKPSGVIATPTGVHHYHGKFTRKPSKLLEITTRSGYKIKVTPEHGLTAWSKDAGERRVEAGHLEPGNWLRLKLGATVDVSSEYKLPKATNGHRNEVKHRIPTTVDEHMAEFLGLMVADGTVYAKGIRIKKCYESVVRRWMYLCKTLFGVDATFLPRKYDLAYGAEVNSTFLARFLCSIPGLAPRKKAIPNCILQSPLRVQAKFLSGLFEDGTVNMKGNRVDHIHFDSVYPRIRSTVQIMLLRFGIISQVARNTVYLYGQNAAMFRGLIRFVAPEKNHKLYMGKFSPSTMYSVPITPAEQETLAPFLSASQKRNVRRRGYWSRATVQDLLTRVNCPKLAERICNWHYEPIKSIRVVSGASMCIEVPYDSRFLQNGFDGWNSKGLEFPTVYVPQMTAERFPHARAVASGMVEEERRLAYVAITRAKDHLRLSTTSNTNPSPFIEDMGLMKSSLDMMTI